MQSREQTSEGVEEVKNEVEKKEDSSGKLNKTYETAARPYVDLIDQLRSMGIEKDIEIPQIVVMGDQSSGKSSVLESLCGVPFPRGSGLVTRCATQIRMKKVSHSSVWSARVSLSTTWQPDECGEVSSPPELGTRIEELTKRLLEGSNAEFSTESIVIDISSADVSDLTVVDLPGIIRTTTQGLTGSAIDDVNALIDSYLQQSRTIILAVIPANVDIATVDILERAAKVDPDGDRTVGVFTKPDLVDRGTEKEVVAGLTNQLKPLKHGYSMLRNRSNQELLDDMPIADAHEMEKNYFRSHTIYGSLPQEYFGIHNLSDKLTTILVGRIQHHMPAMKEELLRMLRQTSAELLNMGTPPPSDSIPQLMEYGKMCESFVSVYCHAVDGRYVDPVFTENPSMQLCATARKQFTVLSTNLRHTRPNFNDEDFIQNLVSKIANSRGRELPGFMSLQVFQNLMSSYVELWRGPSLQCLDEIEKECLHFCERILRLKFGHYPAMYFSALGAVSKCIERASAVARGDIESTVTREIEEPFTQNHYFMDTVNKLRAERFSDGLEQLLQKSPVVYPYKPQQKNFAKDKAQEITDWYMNSIGNTSNEMQEAQDMNIILQSYWKVAHKKFCDCIPQMIQKVLFDEVKVQLSRVLVCHDSQKIASFFEVPLELQTKRVQLEEKQSRITLAIDKLQAIEARGVIGCWKPVDKA